MCKDSDEIGKKGDSCGMKEEERSRRQNEELENTERREILMLEILEGAMRKREVFYV